MHRYLITGVSGFVAGHFLQMLADTREQCEVVGVDIASSPFEAYPFQLSTSKLDLMDATAVERLVLDFRPTRVLHLASFSNVGASWQKPAESFANNTNIFLNLLEALRKNDIAAKVLSVGSSEEYGNVSPAELPLVETRRPRPESPYAVARVAQEELSRVYVEGFGMDIVMTRSFNHIGSGQREQFVVPSFVKQMVMGWRSGLEVCTVRTGNTKVVRDFLDVRDVVAAYWALLDRGRSGEVYNVCSGTGRSLDQVLESVAGALGVSVLAQPDPNLIRPNELMAIVGSSEKIRRELGWSPKIPFDQCLAELVEYWKVQTEASSKLNS